MRIFARISNKIFPLRNKDISEKSNSEGSNKAIQAQDSVNWSAGSDAGKSPVLPDNFSFKEAGGLKRVKSAISKSQSASEGSGVFGSLCSKLISRYNSFMRVIFY